jgi:hypothetical protein
MPDIASEFVDVKAHVDHGADEQESRNARSWRDFAELINGAWRKGPEAILDACQYLAEAKEELARDEFDALVRFKLVFDASTAKKLICIGHNRVLGAHVHLLPPCWSTIYELTKLTDEALRAAIADGNVSPKMLRKDALALRKPAAGDHSPSPRSKSTFAAVWDAASVDEIRAKLDKVGRAGLCRVLSESLKADLRDHDFGATISAASKSTAFATQATDKLHTALRCAEQREPSDEDVRKMAAALGCILRAAEKKGVARSDIVIAQGKPKNK